MDQQTVTVDPSTVDEHGQPALDLSGNPDIVPDDPTVEVVTRPKRVGRFATFMNLTNGLIGAGIIGVPSTFKYCGVGPTTLLLILCCTLCHISGVIMINLQRTLDVGGLDAMALKVFGKYGEITTACLVIFFSMSCTVAYLIIGSTQIRSWIGLTGLDVSSNTAWMLITFLYWALLVGPMTFPKSVSFLSGFSTVSIFGILIYAVVLIVKTSKEISNGVSPTAIGTRIDMGLFTAFGVHALTFSLPVIMMPIITPYNPSIKKRTFVLGVTFLLSWFLISVPGILGYLTFGDETGSDILQSFPSDDLLINLVKITIFICVTFSFPVVIVSIVGSLGQIFFNQSIPELMTTKNRLIIVIIVNLVNLVIAMTLQDIQPVLGIGGSLGGCTISFILPSACSLMITKEPKTSFRNILHILFVVFGIFATVLCTYSSIESAIAAL